jgi:hypothetical protein
MRLMLRPHRLQPGQSLAAAGFAEAIEAGQLAAMTGEDRRPAGTAGAILLAESGLPWWLFSAIMRRIRSLTAILSEGLWTH